MECNIQGIRIMPGKQYLQDTEQEKQNWKCEEIYTERGCVCPQVKGMGRWLRMESEREREKTTFQKRWDPT